MNINGKIIMMGDMHFGDKRFCETSFNKKIEFVKKQLIPYMKENNIKDILQLGDLFDNRVVADINFLHNFIKEFIGILKEHNITIYVITGNHDIYFRDSREVTLLNIMDSLYENFIMINSRKYANINNSKSLLVPWVLKDETLTKKELDDIEYIFGHFEIRNFQLSKGIIDKTSKLSDEFFNSKNLPKLKRVYSGHYHLKESKGLINYIGTPYQLSHSDINEVKGFYVINEDNSLSFIENKVSPRHILITWDSSREEEIVLHDLDISTYNYNDNSGTFEELFDEFKEFKIKLIIQSLKDEKLSKFLEEISDFDISIVYESSYTKQNEPNSVNSVNKHNLVQSKELIIQAMQDINVKYVPVIIKIIDDIENKKKG